MGQIVGLKAKPKRCNLNALGSVPTPAAGEYILVSYDNSMTANGQGNFDRYIIGDGRTAATALELKYLDDSTRPYIVEEVNKAVADIQPIEITGDVTNAPDEEDLTSENQGGTDVLKFKDKAYNSALYSGLGRTYLRKNIVNGFNVLTQAMVNTANTIYHIQYDYDLNGQTITLPAGCVLEFDGGSLSDRVGTGKIVFADTKICGDAKILCGYEGTIDGMVQGRWFGLVPNDNTFDNAPIIEKVCTTFNQVTISGGKYYCSTPMVLAMGSDKTLIVTSDLEYIAADTSNTFITISGARLFLRFTGAIYGPTPSISSDNVTELSIGVRLEYLFDCDLYIKYVTNFHTDVQVYANNVGLSYNSFIFDTLVGAKTLLHLKAEGTGWISSCTIRCNRLTSFNGLTQPDTAILVEGEQATFTDVVFTKMSLEGFMQSEPIKIYNASRMKFQNIRNERNYQYFAYVENATNLHFQSNYGNIAIRSKAKDKVSVFDDNNVLIPYAPLDGTIRRPDGNKRQILFNSCDATKAQDVNYGAITYRPIGFIAAVTHRPIVFSSKDKFSLYIAYFDSSLNLVSRSDAVMPSGTVYFENTARVSEGMVSGSEAYEIAISFPELTGVAYIGFFFTMSAGRGKDIWNPKINCPRFLMETINTSFYAYDVFFEYQKYGTTAQRPVITENWRNFVVGFEYFDTTLGKPIYAKTFDSSGNGTWVDATGAVV